jgi:predicted O-linked N-acetylglucosamine transferase (SPINDLY family)
MDPRLSKKSRRPAQPPLALQTELQRGLALHQRGRLADAERIYAAVVQRAPNYFDALHLLGVITYETGSHERAVQLISKAISINPDVASAYYNRGNALQELKRLEEALASYNKAVALESNYVEAYYNRGIALHQLKRFEEALASYDKVIALRPDLAEPYSNRGVALNELKRFEEALASFNQAITLRPDFTEAYYNRGIALYQLKRVEEALSSYDKALALRSRYSEAPSLNLAELYSYRGIAFSELRRFGEALDNYEKAIALKPDYAEAYSNRGSVLHGLKRYEEASTSYAKAIALKPNYSEGDALHIRMKVCDWANIRDDIASLENAISAGAAALTPFTILTLSQSPALQIKNARKYVEVKHPKNDCLGSIRKRRRRDKIRIGYFSADFRLHAVAHVMSGVFDRHDKSKFETFAFSFNRGEDAITSRLRQSFDHFIDVHNMPDEHVAVLAREKGIDISIDLMGFTAGHRTGTFAHRTAPIQVNYLGFAGTMGSEYIDYIISDEVLIQKSQQTFYAEKVAYVPDSYFPTSYHDSRLSSERAFARREFGLPEVGCVFCCFNNNYKITPDVFEIWMRILNQVEGSVLWLFEDNPTAAANLRKEAGSRHVDPDRLVFAHRIPSLPEHMARHRLADLFLDTLPYNAHTTAADALWSGLPVLTRIGETFAGRVAASLLTAIGLPELITTSPEAYEALAIDFATNPDKLSSIKNRLIQNRLTAPLFDTERLTRHLEAAYAAMYERYQADLPPDHIYVPQ